MEIDFKQQSVSYLQDVLWEEAGQQLTQEFRLGDGMPDIGRVLFSGGQIMIRSKEWQSGRVSCTGGVMAWAIYAPEDGTACRSVNQWMPFQLNWEIREGREDGTLRLFPQIRYVDCRSVSGRKLNFRVEVGVLAQALFADKADYYIMDEQTAQLQILEKTYPVYLRKEAGEKSFVLDEVLELEEMPEKILGYEMIPQIQDSRIIGNKAVFKGSAGVKILGITEDGRVRQWQKDVEFSQFAQLEEEYGETAVVRVWPMVTSLEVEPEDGGRLKCGITAQYLIEGSEKIRVVEDVYCLKADVEVEREKLKLPVVLDRYSESIGIEEAAKGRQGLFVYGNMYTEQPGIVPANDALQVQLGGYFPILYQQEDGALQGANVRWEKQHKLVADESARVQLTASPQDAVYGRSMGEELSLGGKIRLEGCFMGTLEGETLCKVNIKEEKKPDPNRPALVLRRKGRKSLWQLAKEYKTTVREILEANHMADEPEGDGMLLIPIP